MNEIRGLSGGPSDGRGEGTINEQGTEVLGEAFQSIAQSMGHMVEGIRSIEMKMELTDQAVRSLAQGLKIQGQRMLKLEQRINMLEDNVVHNSPSEEKMSLTVSPEHSASELPPLRYPVSKKPELTWSAVNAQVGRSQEDIRTNSAETGLEKKHLPNTGIARSLSCTTCSQLVQNSSRLGGADRTALGRCLLAAAHDGRLDDAVKLLDAGADVNFPNSCKWTPLHRAATKAHVDVLELLLRRGASVEATNAYGFTALHMAATNDFKGKCVSLLLDHGSNVDCKNRSGRTPLHCAAERGNVVVVRMLMAAGANKNIKDAEGRTPFAIAKSQYVRRFLSPGRARRH